MNYDLTNKTDISCILNIPEEHIEFKNDLWYIMTDVYITNELIENGELLINFAYVGGDFYCSPNINVKIKFYMKEPEIIKFMSKKDYDDTVIRLEECYMNKKLKTLKGCPTVVKGSFNCSYNELTDLNYAPKHVGEKTICCNNSIKSIPDYVDIALVNLYKNSYFYFKKYNYDY